MEFVLENELLRVTMDSHGAEVTSVVDKASGKELWWNGDPTSMVSPGEWSSAHLRLLQHQ